MARKLPLYLLLDTSGSMRGEAIEALNNGVSLLLNMLYANPMALDSLWVSIITFDREVKEIVPLTPLTDVNIPLMNCPRSGATMMGEALAFLLKAVKRDLVKSDRKHKGDFRPIMVIFTDGKASDISLFNEMVDKIPAVGFSTILACAAGDSVNINDLAKLTPHVMKLDELDGEQFRMFFQWVSHSVEQKSKSLGIDSDLPPLPPPPFTSYVL